MREIVEQRTCDVCLNRQRFAIPGNEKLPEMYYAPEPVYDWLEIGDIVDVCPGCAQLIHRASQMGWLADIVAACDEAFDDQKPSQG